MGTKRRELSLETKRRILASMMRELDDRDAAPDTVPTGFPSVDKLLGGGLRTGDLTILGGDAGSGKSALAMAVRAATLGVSVSFVSGEMDEGRLPPRCR
jgi:DNA repair protein RadA/Sms